MQRTYSKRYRRMAPPTVLVTGGAGYIGSHTVLEMLNAGYNVICVDNLCNAYSGGASKLPEALSRVQEITGKKVNFYRVDITDREQVRSVFQEVSLDLSGTSANHLMDIVCGTIRAQTVPSCSLIAIARAINILFTQLPSTSDAPALSSARFVVV